jgi:hypothetical protein
MQRIALLLALVGRIAVADPELVEESPEATVYRDGDQVFVFADKRMGQLYNYATNLDLTIPKLFNVRETSELGVAGIPWFWRRLRIIDGKLTCERFSRRPKPPATYESVIPLLAAAPCN